jgi:hypothetical protein
MVIRSIFISPSPLGGNGSGFSSFSQLASAKMLNTIKIERKYILMTMQISYTKQNVMSEFCHTAFKFGKIPSKLPQTLRTNKLSRFAN